MQVKHSTTSKVPFADEAGPSTTLSVPATPSTPNTDTTTVTSLSTDDLYTDAFNFALSKKISSTLMASLTPMDGILKEIRDCVLTDNEDRCRQISPYIRSFWKDLHIKNGCVCIDAAVSHRHPQLNCRSLYGSDSCHTSGELGMTDMATHAGWPYKHLGIVTKTAKCNPCVKIGKNLKSIFPASK